MKETEFIDQNKKKWAEIEKNLTSNQLSPSDTSKLFIQVTDDLSYARTFYKNRSVKIYLNEITKFLFNDINKTKSSNIKAFIRFWKKDLPLAMYVSRRSMLISFVVFACCFTLGVITSMHDPNFCKSILSSGYIDMTNENIAKGDAMAVYKQDGEMQTFLPIFVNNVRIDFITFFSGIFFAIGSLFIMIVNGVMVGVFQYFFIEKGLFWESFLAIWTHGTLEISAIIISGGAGLTLGKGLLFPGTYSRFHAFKASGMNGLKIICGVVPVTLMAAFIEGFLTRHTDIPDAIRFSFILLSLAFVLVYFFWYPRRVAKATEDLHASTETDPVYKHQHVFSPFEILNREKLIKETFRIILKNFGSFGGLSILMSFVIAILIATDQSGIFVTPDAIWFQPEDLFTYFEFPVLGILCLAAFVFLQYRSLLFLRKDLNPGNTNFSKRNVFITVLISSFVFVCFMGMASEGYKMFAFILLPVLSLISCIAIGQNVSILKAVNLIGSLLNKQWGTFFLGMIFTFTICWMVYLTFAFGTKYLLLENSLLWILTDDELTAEKIKFGIAVFRIVFSFFMYLLLNAVFHSMFFYTLKEINTAENLISRIQQIKASK
jgi:uncharacterized membrane protein SpoIIM required for sporulation